MFDWSTALITFCVIEYCGTVTFSMYCHRFLGHRHWDLHPVLQHFSRFYLWLLSGYGSWPNWQQQYAAQHRKHHMLSDQPGDPTSPHQFTNKELFLNVSNIKENGPWYISKDDVKKYAPDIVSSDDWLQRNFYSKKQLGKIIFWIGFTAIFGIPGFILGAINFFCIDWYAVLVGAYGIHKWGTIPKSRSKFSKDQSRNSWPWFFIGAGEELHGYHHDQPWLPNFGRKWYEIDATYCVGKCLSFFKLVKFNRRPQNFSIENRH